MYSDHKRPLGQRYHREIRQYFEPNENKYFGVLLKQYLREMYSIKYLY